MCLIPTSVVRAHGAALPYFIKWDDTEFALRAANAGVDTVTVPGAALWHLPWTGKDDGLDWQAYFQLRNRIVTALLHARTRRGGSILRATLALDVNHVLCMQYGSAAARRLALRDVLCGPHALDQTLETRTAQVRDLMARAGQVVIDEASLPAARFQPSFSPPASRASALGRLMRVVAHQCIKTRPADDGFVDHRLSRSEGKWWALGLLDSATVESATGRGAFVARRNRRTAIALLRDAVALRARLWMAWPALARDYRLGAPALASVDVWEQRFASHARTDG
jgi:galactofuranosylgalactofuranosylrhamnosyl-N-acetylglucosaminyl-diphospho-decaprenol beta-1,5/1,6-galactofuranosyltransferase